MGNGVAKFYKVSFEQFIKDYQSEFTGTIYEQNDGSIKQMYDDIILPKRATKFSAGYDFISPFDFTLNPGEVIKLPTGVKCEMNTDVCLLIFPRSSLGFKYRFILNNTVGIIDSDYFNCDNEGHIWTKWTNDGDKILEIKKGMAFAQGVFINYLTTVDDAVESERVGGLGSTTKK